MCCNNCSCWHLRQSTWKPFVRYSLSHAICINWAHNSHPITAVYIRYFRFYQFCDFPRFRFIYFMVFFIIFSLQNEKKNNQWIYNIIQFLCAHLLLFTEQPKLSRNWNRQCNYLFIYFIGIIMEFLVSNNGCGELLDETRQPKATTLIFVFALNSEWVESFRVIHTEKNYRKNNRERNRKK